MSTIVIVDQDSNALSAATLRAIAIARALGDPYVALTPEGGSPEIEERLAALGAPRVIFPARPVPPIDSSRTAALIDEASDTIGGADLILAPPTIGMRDAIGRLGMRHRAEVLTGVTEVQRVPGTGFAARSVFDGGRRQADTEVRGALYALVDPTPCPVQESPVVSQRTLLPASAEPTVRVLERAQLPTALTAPLQSAEIIVAGGRGMGSPDAFDRLRRWAEASGFTFGSSRAPVESEWTDYDRLIGQTGTTIAPRLYVTFGISGAPQHVSGITNAERIVAINTDPGAPIAGYADLMIVADAAEMLEALEGAVLDPSRR